ncbi:hypothetical protein WT21_09445 [Burkholderia territorii]|nr:hypothetical protein WS79_20150 [Burkholderia territorii]KVQ51738.1 hypothetical protein WT21_09445 [Burkholderia territorii]KWE31356.1 hypothetical protein WT49_20415 [Burkholderia territorii]KWE31954.1 hypothetical protein WT50_03555 [Burkholderia territorii]KWE53679.1 hypothetical protein WT51_07260 [Burkholderia territorii]
MRVRDAFARREGGFGESQFARRPGGCPIVESPRRLPAARYDLTAPLTGFREVFPGQMAMLPGRPMRQCIGSSSPPPLRA